MLRATGLEATLSQRSKVVDVANSVSDHLPVTMGVPLFVGSYLQVTLYRFSANYKEEKFASNYNNLFSWSLFC